MKKTNKINKKTGILIGVGSALSIGTMMVVLLKRKTKKGSVLEKDDFDFDFDEIEEDSCVNDKFDTEKDKDDIGKEEIDSLVDEYLEYESKTEEEKQEEFRDLSIKVMDLLLKEVISMSETLDLVKRDMDRIGEVKALVEELENCKEEIISLWEHMEKLSDLREEITGKKNRG
ncbi:hypothetical protein HMPREF9628_02117 [Peptoanaerobacter stomatis]|uniref:Uncharacterized protein n=1 Tax=Peptoanaerobacter stomatis TaxID=796937 RepID=G9XEP7_9FIRM|nr:hypothetical protein [Peptoanaerobacter stomatis]EHL18232.1 hypothetical protein HMPREF9628_02117 [Peptoanaerobacter stomatis]